MKAAVVVVACMVLLACSGADETSSGGAGAGANAGTGGEAVGAGASGGSTGTAMTGGGGSAPTPVGCYDYDAFSPLTVSFADDVMPIFANRCASCHADPNESVYYGADAAVVYDKAHNGTPKQAPHLSFVVPNEPLVSYMLAKVEYQNPGGTCSLVQCSEPGCELFAPPAGMLPEAELAVLRSWVMTGAAND